MQKAEVVLSVLRERGRNGMVHALECALHNGRMHVRAHRTGPDGAYRATAAARGEGVKPGAGAYPA